MQIFLRGQDFSSGISTNLNIVKYSFSDVFRVHHTNLGHQHLYELNLTSASNTGHVIGGDFNLTNVSHTIFLVVTGPAPEHCYGPGDRRWFQHGQDIHRHGLRRA